MIEGGDFRCGSGSWPPAETVPARIDGSTPKIVDRRNVMKMLTIVSPSGETGRWLFDEYTIGTSLENTVSILSNYINNGTTGFNISITKCDEVVHSDSIELLKDANLKYIDIPAAIIYSGANAGKIKKNKDIFTRMVAEAATNSNYANWFYKRINELIEQNTDPMFEQLKDDFSTALDALS